MGKILHYLVRLYCLFLRMTGGKLVGARALIFSKDDSQVLLVYHTYCPNWHLPGGGVKRGEHPLQAARREVLEEAGVECLEDPKFFGAYYQTYLHADDYPFVYVIKSFKQKDVHSPEIKECRWFSVDKLPQDMDPGSFERIQEYLLKKTPALFWHVRD